MPESSSAASSSVLDARNPGRKGKEMMKKPHGGLDKPSSPTGISEDVDRMDLDDLPQEPEQTWTPEQVRAFVAKLQEVVRTYPTLNEKLQSAGETVQGLLPHVKTQYDELTAALGRNASGVEWNQRELWGLKGTLQQFNTDVSQIQSLTNNRMDEITFEIIRQKGALSDLSKSVGHIPGQVHHMSGQIDSLSSQLEIIRSDNARLKEMTEKTEGKVIEALNPLFNVMQESLAKLADSVTRQGKFLLAYDRNADDVPEITSDIFMDQPQAIRDLMTESEPVEVPPRHKHRHESEFRKERYAWQMHKNMARSNSGTPAPEPRVVQIGDPIVNTRPSYGQRIRDGVLFAPLPERGESSKMGAARGMAGGNGGNGGPPPSKKRAADGGSEPSDYDENGAMDWEEGPPPRRFTPPKRPRLYSEEPDDRIWDKPMKPSETDIPDPEKYDMRRGSDYRPYLQDCERVIRHKPHRFPTEEAKISWAIAFLKGDRAKTWGHNYERRLFQPGGDLLCDWARFKMELTQECDDGFDGIEAISDMESWSYRGDVGAYIEKLKHLNTRACLTGNSLHKVVIQGLPRVILQDLYRYGNPSSDNELWEFVRRAGKSYEVFVRSEQTQSQGKRAKGKWSENRDTSGGDNANSSSKGKSKDKPKKKTPNNTSKREPKKEWPKRFNSLEEATRGLPKSVVQERMGKDQCPRCGITGHKSLFCGKELKVAAVSKSDKKEKKEKEKEPAIQSVTTRGPGGRVFELDDDCSDSE